MAEPEVLSGGSGIQCISPVVMYCNNVLPIINYGRFVLEKATCGKHF